MYSADAHIRNVIQTDLFSAKFQIRKASVITSGRKLFSSMAVTHENYTIEMGHIWNKRTVMAYFHCRTRIRIRTQDRFLYYAGLSIGLDLDSDPLIEMYVIGTEVSPWDGDPFLKWVQ